MTRADSRTKARGRPPFLHRSKTLIFKAALKVTMESISTSCPTPPSPGSRLAFVQRAAAEIKNKLSSSECD